MNRIVLKTLIILLAIFTQAIQADAQLLKKTKKPNAKELLAIERQRTDSLTSIIEEYRLREKDWQKAWYEQKEEKKENPRKVFTVDYTPAKADSLAEQLKLQQVDDALQNFFNDYVCEGELYYGFGHKNITITQEASLSSVQIPLLTVFITISSMKVTQVLPIQHSAVFHTVQT